MRVAYRALLVVLTLLRLSCVQSEPASDPALASATRFVNAFYHWYLPAAQKGAGVQAAVRDSAALFAPPLASALRMDAEAQARSAGEIVGLDWDPFLDAQDFCEAYEVGLTRREAGEVLVDVRGSCQGRMDSLPDVVAELMGSGSTWVFVNFRYPRRNSDLMKDLNELRRAREASR